MLLHNGINYQTTFIFSGGRTAGKLILAPKKKACGLFQTTFSAAGLSLGGTQIFYLFALEDVFHSVIIFVWGLSSSL